MDLSWSAEDEVFRAEARAWLEANVPRPALPSGDTREGFARHLEWERRLYDERWAVVSWPEEFGGRGASLWQWLIFEEEYYRAAAPQRVTQNGIFLLAPTVFEFGTAEQRSRILPRMASAQDLWCQGWSEPSAGQRSGGHRQSGRTHRQRLGAARPEDLDRARGVLHPSFGLFRTDPDAVRHRGLTYFLVPLDTPGVTVRRLRRLDGDEGSGGVP